MPLSRKELQEVSSRVYPDLERVPGKQNWVDKTGGLPSYIERIAKHMHYERGRPIGQAIASAVATTKRWCSTGKNWNGGDLKPTTRAKACKAVASWEAKKAKSKAKTAAKKLKESVEMQEARELLEANTALPCDDNVAKELAGLVRKRLTIAEGMLPALQEPRTVGKLGLVKKAIELMESELGDPVSIGMIGGPAADPRDMKKVADLLEAEVDELRALAESLGEDVKPWEKKNPKGKGKSKKLTPDQKAKAKARAKKAGRKYPNLVDNMAAAQMQEGAGPWMKEGDKGEQVMEMQKQVEGMGRFIGDAGADGKFGYQTKQGVKAIQRREGLKADGIVGPETKAMLDKKMPTADLSTDAPMEKPVKEEADVPSWGTTSAARRLRAAKAEMQEANDKGAIAGWLDMVAKAATERNAEALAGMFKDKTWPEGWDADIDEMLYEGEDDKLEAMRKVIGAIRSAGDRPLDKSFFESLFMDDMDDREEMAEADVEGSGTAEAATDGNTVTAPPGPPNLRESRGGDMNCGTCESFEGGKCVAHSASVSPTQVCDDWKADGEMAEGMKVEVEVKIEKGKKDKGEGYEEGYEQEGKEDCGCDKGDHAYCPNCGMTHGSSSCGCGHEWEGDEKYCPECGSANKPIIAVLEGPEIAEATIDNRLRGAAMSGLRGLASNRSGWTAARKAAIKRLNDGTFAPKGRGKVLYPGDNVDLGGTRGKVDLDGKSITLGNGRKLKLNKAAQATPQMATPTRDGMLGKDESAALKRNVAVDKLVARNEGKSLADQAAAYSAPPSAPDLPLGLPDPTGADIEDAFDRMDLTPDEGMATPTGGGRAFLEDWVKDADGWKVSGNGNQAWTMLEHDGKNYGVALFGDSGNVVAIDPQLPPEDNVLIDGAAEVPGIFAEGNLFDPTEAKRWARAVATGHELKMKENEGRQLSPDERTKMQAAFEKADAIIEGQMPVKAGGPDTGNEAPGVNQPDNWQRADQNRGAAVLYFRPSDGEFAEFSGERLLYQFDKDEWTYYPKDGPMQKVDAAKAQEVMDAPDEGMATPTGDDSIRLTDVQVGEFVKTGSSVNPIYGRVTAQIQGTGFASDRDMDQFGSVEVTSKDGTKRRLYRGTKAQVVPEEEAMAAPAPLDPPNPGIPPAPSTPFVPPSMAAPDGGMATPTRQQSVMADIERMTPGDTKTFAGDNIRVSRTDEGFSVDRKENSWDDTYDIADGEGMDATKAAELVAELGGERKVDGDTYEERVAALEREGLSTSDAQAVADRNPLEREFGDDAFGNDEARQFGEMLTPTFEWDDVGEGPPDLIPEEFPEFDQDGIKTPGVVALADLPDGAVGVDAKGRRYRKMGAGSVQGSAVIEGPDGSLWQQSSDTILKPDSEMATPTFEWDDVGEGPADQIPEEFPEYDQDGIKTPGVIALADLPTGSYATDAKGRRYRKLGAGSVQGSAVIEGPDGDLWQQSSDTILKPLPGVGDRVRVAGSDDPLMTVTRVEGDDAILGFGMDREARRESLTDLEVDGDEGMATPTALAQIANSIITEVDVNDDSITLEIAQNINGEIVRRPVNITMDPEGNGAGYVYGLPETGNRQSYHQQLKGKHITGVTMTNEFGIGEDVPVLFLRDVVTNEESVVGILADEEGNGAGHVFADPLTGSGGMATPTRVRAVDAEPGRIVRTGGNSWIVSRKPDGGTELLKPDGRKLAVPDELEMDEGDIQDMLDYQYMSMMTPTNPAKPELAAAGSPIRSGAGRIRNVKAMSNEKLLMVSAQQTDWNQEQMDLLPGRLMRREVPASMMFSDPGDTDGTKALNQEIIQRMALPESDPKHVSPADIAAASGMAMATPTRSEGDRLDVSDITGVPGDSATLISQSADAFGDWLVQHDRTGAIYTLANETVAKLDDRGMATPGRIQNFMESGDVLQQIDEPDMDIADGIELIETNGDGTMSIIQYGDQRFSVMTPTAVHDQALSRLMGEMAGDFDTGQIKVEELPSVPDSMELPLGSKLANVPTTKSYVEGREIVTPLTAADLSRVEDGVLDGKVVNQPVGPAMMSPTAKQESVWREDVLVGRIVRLPGGTRINQRARQDGTVTITHQGLSGQIHADGLSPEDVARVVVQAASALDAYDRGEFDEGRTDSPDTTSFADSASKFIFEAALDGEPDALAEISGLSPDNFISSPDWMATPTTPNPTPLPDNYGDNNEAIEFQHLPMGSYFADAGGYTYVLHKPAGADGKWYIAKPVDPEGNIITEDPHPAAGTKKAHGPTRRIFHFRQPPRSLGGTHPDYVEDHDVTGSSQVPDATDVVTQPDAPETVVTGKYGIEAYEAGSPVRSPKGNVRNVKAMSNGKFLGVYEDMQAFATIDPEGFERVNAEFGRRSSLPADDPKSLQTVVAPNIPSSDPTPTPGITKPAAQVDKGDEVIDPDGGPNWQVEEQGSAGDLKTTTLKRPQGEGTESVTVVGTAPVQTPPSDAPQPSTINPKLSPARSAKGNVRNIKAMNDEKLIGLISQMQQDAGDGTPWGAVDTESYEKIKEVAGQRGLYAPDLDDAVGDTAPTPAATPDLPESEQGIYNAIKDAVDGPSAPSNPPAGSEKGSADGDMLNDAGAEVAAEQAGATDDLFQQQLDAITMTDKLAEVADLIGVLDGEEVQDHLDALRARGVDIDLEAESAETLAAVVKATSSMATPTMAPAYGDQLGSASDILTPDEIQSIVDGAPGVSIASSIGDGNIPSVPRLERLKLLLPEDGTAATAVDKLISKGSPSMATPTARSLTLNYDGIEAISNDMGSTIKMQDSVIAAVRGWSLISVRQDGGAYRAFIELDTSRGPVVTSRVVPEAHVIDRPEGSSMATPTPLSSDLIQPEQESLRRSLSPSRLERDDSAGTLQTTDGPYETQFWRETYKPPSGYEETILVAETPRTVKAQRDSQDGQATEVRLATQDEIDRLNGMATPTLGGSDYGVGELSRAELLSELGLPADSDLSIDELRKRLRDRREMVDMIGTPEPPDEEALAAGEPYPRTRYE